MSEKMPDNKEWPAERVLHLINMMCSSVDYTGFPCWIGGLVRKWRQNYPSSTFAGYEKAAIEACEKKGSIPAIEKYKQRCADLAQPAPASDAVQRAVETLNYEQIYDTACCKYRLYQCAGIRGQMITERDGLDYWVMIATAETILAALRGRL